MAKGPGAAGRRLGGGFNYQQWAEGGFRFEEPEASPPEDDDVESSARRDYQQWAAGDDRYQEYDRGLTLDETGAALHHEREEGYGSWDERHDYAEQGPGDMSQREVDETPYDYDSVPNRFDIDGYGAGLFGGPGADLFGAHGVPDSLPEQMHYNAHSGPMRAVEPEPEPEPVAESGSLVRPYTRTGGRTKPDYDLAIEALVSTSEKGMERDAAVLPEHRSICGLCVDTRSVAEVAAHLRLPLGVVRVLIGDMASMGLVLIHQGGLVVGDRPSIEFLERVLSGLRRL